MYQKQKKMIPAENKTIFSGWPGAACLPPTLLSRALIAARPLLLVVPDIRARRQPPDLSHLVRAQLGIEA